jgi:hypothetical protein
VSTPWHEWNAVPDKHIVERLDIIDFCDAAAEWGSIVPIPAREADRMIELADQRCIADSDEPRASREDRHVRFEVHPHMTDYILAKANVDQERRR